MSDIKNSPPLNFRHAVISDLPALTAIYNHYIVNTPITFDLEPFTVEARQGWLSQFQPGSRHQCLVAEVNQQIAGYASSGPLRPKAAYNTSVECSIYLHPDKVGHGLGRRLYQQLFELLEQQDVHRCYGLITLPNEASLALHTTFGFAEVGHMREVGRKFGQYWDTLWVEKNLGSA